MGFDFPQGLGICPDFEKLQINPCIPEDWNEFSVVRKWRGAEFEIQVLNPDGVMKGVKQIELDGKVVEHIPVQEKGSIHKVNILMG